MREARVASVVRAGVPVTGQLHAGCGAPAVHPCHQPAGDLEQVEVSGLLRPQSLFRQLEGVILGVHHVAEQSWQWLLLRGGNQTAYVVDQLVERLGTDV